MRIRVLALVTEAFGGTGGIAQYNRDLSRAIASSDAAEVIILPRSSNGTEESLPDKVTQRRPIGNKFNYALEALLHSRPSVDVLFCGHLYMAPLAYLLARRFRATFWLQIHGIEAWQEPSILRRWAADRADLVTSVSRYSRGHFLRWTRLAPDRVRVLPNTYNERFIPGPKSDRLLERYDLHGRQVLLTLGRLSSTERYKGQDRMIRLLPALRRTYPKIAYVVAGEGEDRERLANLARDLRVEDLVRLVGAVPPNQLPDLYRTADVFVMPSTGEGFGIAFLEAAASGLRVVGGSKDGGVDALRDGKVGFVVNPDDQGQLLDAVLAALKSESAEPANLRVFERSNFEDYVHSLLAFLGPARK